MNDPRISIREATEDDAQAIAKMHATSWQATYRGLLPDVFLESESKHGRLDHWTTRMRTPSPAGRLVVIVEWDGEPAGFVCAERKPESADGVLLDNLHVMERYQGYGLGRRLMETVERWASELGETQLYLFVLEGNSRAMGFYERQGCRFAGIETEEIAGKPVTARRYVRTISPRGG
jgi:GNAT superfamily N-acetyltransferase